MNSKLKYLLPIRSIMFILIFVIGSTIVNKNISDISNWWSIVATIVNVVTIITLLLVCKKMNISYSKLINYEKGKTKVKEVIIMTLIVLVFVSIGMNIAFLIQSVDDPNSFMEKIKNFKNFIGDKPAVDPPEDNILTKNINL